MSFKANQTTWANLKQSAARKAASPYANWWLGIFSFTDSSVSPLPPDPLLAVLSYLRPTSWQRLALITTGASIVGALLGYGLGSEFGDEIISFLTDHYSLGSKITAVSEQYNNHVILALFTAAFTPIPFKVFTVSAGVFGINLGLFLVTITIGRGIRFGLVAFIAAKFGSIGLKVFNRYLFWFTILGILITLWLFYH